MRISDDVTSLPFENPFRDRESIHQEKPLNFSWIASAYLKIPQEYFRTSLEADRFRDLNHHLSQLENMLSIVLM